MDRSASSRTSLLDPRTTTDTVLPWFWIPVIYKHGHRVVRIRDLKFLLWAVYTLMFTYGLTGGISYLCVCVHKIVVNDHLWLIYNHIS